MHKMKYLKYASDLNELRKSKKKCCKSHIRMLFSYGTGLFSCRKHYSSIDDFALGEKRRQMLHIKTHKLHKMKFFNWKVYTSQMQSYIQIGLNSVNNLKESFIAGGVKAISKPTADTPEMVIDSRCSVLFVNQLIKISYKILRIMYIF